jgi:Ferric iron reductase FhuF-like transporter/FhuF 2Fe-2S C-terminal domain
VLDELAALGPFFAVSTHPPQAIPLPPWRPVSELTGRHGPLRARMDAVRSTLAARGRLDVAAIDPRIAASALHLGLVARLAAPALGAAVLGQPIDPRPAEVWWQDVPSGPVPLSVPAPSEDQVPNPVHPNEWDQLLMAEAIAPITLATARLAGVSPRVLWGNVASGVNAAAAQLARQRPDLAGAAWKEAARLFASPWLHGERNPPGPSFRRSSCCLFYRLAPNDPSTGRSVNLSATCGDCVLGGPRAR